MTDSQLRVYILIITNLLAKIYPNLIVYQHYKLIKKRKTSSYAYACDSISA